MKKHYSLVKEHPQSYEIHDKRDDSKFHVAKQSLDLEMHGKLARLPHYDEGTASAGGLLSDVGTGLKQGWDAITTQLPDSPSFYDDSKSGPPLMSDFYPQKATPVPATAIPDSAPPSAAPAAVDSRAPAEEQMAAAAPSPDAGVLGQFKANQSAIESGARNVGEAQAAQSNEEAGAREKANWHLQGIMNDAQAERDAFEWKNQKLAEQVANAKIDPQHYIHSMGTGNKIIAAIAMALGGAGAAASGQKNLAHEVIQDAINKDIEAQKANLDTKKSLLSQNLAKYNDMRLAQQATFLQMQAMAQGQVAQIAAKHGGAIDQGKTQMLLGQLQQDGLMKGQQLQQSLAQYGVAQKATTSGVPVEAMNLLDEKTRANMAPLPNGLWANAQSPAAAETIKKAVAPYMSLKGDLTELKKLNSLGSVMSASDRARAESLKGQIVVGLNDFAQAHRISEADLGFQKGQMSDPTSVFNKLSSDWNAGSDTLLNSLAGKMSSIYSANMPAYAKSQQVEAPSLVERQVKDGPNKGKTALFDPRTQQFIRYK